MKVIELSDRTIFVDDIKQIYQEDNYNPIRYTVSTKNGDYRINKEDYYEIQDYLLSLNEPIYEELPKEDKKIEKLDLQYKDIIYNPNFNANILMYFDNLQQKINEIIDRLNGDSDDN